MSKRLVIEREIAAPRARVFAAWSDAESLAVWMAPEADFGRADVELDFRVGGRFRIVMNGAQAYEQTGEYLEIVPDTRLVLRWVSAWMKPAEAETRLTVEFADLGGARTKLTLIHDQLPESDAYDGHQQGWTLILQRCATLLES